MSRPEAETRRYGRSAGLLSGALGVAGLLTYLYFALISHALPSHEYGAVVVTWSAVYIASFTCFRPIEQLLARSIAELEQRHGSMRQVLRVAAIVQLSLVAGAVTLALALRGPIAGGLLDDDATLYGVLLVALVGFGAGFYARGVLAGSRNFRGYALLVVLEALTRICFALALALGLSDDPALAAVAIAAAPLASLLALPLALRGERRRALTSPALAEDAAEPSFTLSTGGGFAAAVLLIMLGDQVIVNSGVLFVRAAEGATEAGLIFNVLMLVRAPLVLFLAVAASLLPHLARLRARGAPGDEEAFATAVERTLLVSAAICAAALLAVLAAGPELMQLAFGDELAYERTDLLIVAAGMGAYLAAQTLSQATLALGRARRAAARWALCAAGFAAWNLLAGGIDPVRRAEIGFAAAALALCLLLYAVYRRPGRGERALEPDSPRELEVHLATADEIA